MLHSLLRLAYSLRPKSVQDNFWRVGFVVFQSPATGEVALFGGLEVKEAELAVMAGTVIIIGILAWLQIRTPIGVACQATVTDPQMAESFGISLIKCAISIF